MKITVGMGSIDEYVDYVKAGADEVFCGFVPADWSEKYGLFLPLNRREVLYYNVQLGSESELAILRDMVAFYGVPVTITLNALYYIPEQYPKVADIMALCSGYGFSSFIVADPGLLFYLRKQGLSDRYQIHVSGEISEMNRYFLREMRDMGMNRLIFHRKVTIDQMRMMIDGDAEHEDSDQKDVNQEDTDWEEKMLEFEAFLLNEMCHFHGGFCNTFHCDELCHMCQMPYRLSNLPCNTDVEQSIKTESMSEENISTEDLPVEDSTSLETTSLLGESGCGLCALWDMMEIGITHLKIVGRGNYVDDTIRDIRCVKKALYVLECCDCRDEFIRRMKAELFPSSKCSGNCYYML